MAVTATNRTRRIRRGLVVDDVQDKANLTDNFQSWSRGGVWTPRPLPRGRVGAVAATLRLGGDSALGGEGYGPALVVGQSARPNALVLPDSRSLQFYYPQLRVSALDDPRNVSRRYVSDLLTRVRAIDYTWLAVPRPGGGVWWFVSGGSQFGTWPEATLVWVDDTDDGLGLLTDVSAGLGNYMGELHYAGLQVLEASAVPTLLQERYGPALIYDGFDRPNATAGAGASTGRSARGHLAGIVAGGTASLAGGKLSLPAGVTVYWDTANTGKVARVIECTVQTPATGVYDIRILFRGSGGSTTTSVQWTNVLSHRCVVTINGVAVKTSGAAAAVLGLNRTARLRVIDYGNLVRAYIDDVESTAGDTACASTAAATQTQVGVAVGGTGGTHLIDDFTVYPATITIPSPMGGLVRPPIQGPPAPTGDAWHDIAFGTGSGLPAAFTVWSGTWEQAAGVARMTAAAVEGIATLDARKADHSIAFTMTVPNTTPTYPVDWFCGGVLRYTDSQNYIYFRTLYQTNSVEIFEVWEVVDGVQGSDPIGKINVGTAVTPGVAYAVTAAANGNELAFYWDGELMLQCQTAILTGNHCGIAVILGSATGSGQPTWSDVVVKPAA